MASITRAAERARRYMNLHRSNSQVLKQHFPKNLAEGEKLVAKNYDEWASTELDATKGFNFPKNIDWKSDIGKQVLKSTEVIQEDVEKCANLFQSELTKLMDNSEKAESVSEPSWDSLKRNAPFHAHRIQASREQYIKLREEFFEQSTYAASQEAEDAYVEKLSQFYLEEQHEHNVIQKIVNEASDRVEDLQMQKAFLLETTSDALLRRFPEYQEIVDKEIWNLDIGPGLMPYEKNEAF
eukprot:TRINITY_DN10608_c0_g1_i1.p1 TRINITY_DN10608_c0_g1~~TRINITY_DN10608_c0_g1_i1.p1  ORF type:complete len:256 (-),score=69.38 TRINITY_DN10608_c0_g1_i1:68-784(-)